MRSYERLRSQSTDPVWITIRHALWGRLNISGLLVPLGILLAVMRIPRTARERFALAWVVCALAGAALNLNFSDHYFVPSTAPLVFAIAVLSERQERVSLARRAVLGLVALALVARVPTIANAIRWQVADYAAEARASDSIGRLLATILPPDSRILVATYAPEIYLSSHRDAPGRYANSLGLALTSSDQQRVREREYAVNMRQADAIVTEAHQRLNPELAAIVRVHFVPICTAPASRFRIYIKRQLHVNPDCTAVDASKVDTSNAM
jgi:4-amino-4-deoxy-L-arabinose transferase-like glycosyltransferase